MDGFTRRRAFELGAAALVGGAAGGCGLAGGRRLVATGVALGGLSDERWTPSGSCGSPAAYLRRNPITGRAEALSTSCPHLGCPVRYAAQTESFNCSCHGGMFDNSGNPISGPPKQPLARVQTALRGGQVYLVGVAKACG